MCAKVSYETERDARIALVGAVVSFNRGNNQRKERRLYQCPTCQRFHLTSKEYVSK